MNMNQEENYIKISPTAILTARIRAESTNLPYAKEIYELVKEVAKEYEDPLQKSFLYRIIEKIVKIFNPNMLARMCLLEIRHLAINKVLENYKDYCVLEIAAGLSTRGLERSKKHSFYVETDLSNMINIKSEIVRKLSNLKNLDFPNNYHIISLNALNYEDFKKVGEFIRNNTNSEIVIIHEGLLMYLGDEEKKRFRDNIKRFLKEYSPNGVWVTTDFSFGSRDKLKEGKKDNFFVRMAKRRIEKYTGRKFSLFRNEKEIKEYLRDFSYQKIPVNSILKELTCINRLNLDKNVVKELVESYYPYVIRLK